jgi:hypothetical protein
MADLEQQGQPSAEAACLSAEAQALQLKESTEHCQAALDARNEMGTADRRQIDELADSLRPSFLCNWCKGLLLEPWLVKDCGHLYCFRCLHSMVYENKVRCRFLACCTDTHESGC